METDEGFGTSLISKNDLHRGVDIIGASERVMISILATSASELYGIND